MHSNYTCFQDQLSVIHNRKTNTIIQCIFGINFCRQFYMLVEADTAMLSIDHQGEDKSCSDSFPHAKQHHTSSGLQREEEAFA